LSVLGYSPELAMQEAGRCLECPSRVRLGLPVRSIPVHQAVGRKFKDALDTIKEATFFGRLRRVCPQENNANSAVSSVRSSTLWARSAGRFAQTGDAARPGGVPL